MPKGLLFWVIWVICVLIWAGVNFGGIGGPVAQHMAGGGVIEFVLFGLLGWQVFGPVVSWMLKRNSKFRPDQKGAALAAGIAVLVLFLMWWFGEPPPLPD